MPTPREHWSYTIEEWQKAHFDNLLRALPDITYFFDIGANVGGFTEILLRKYPDALAICFEPARVNYEELVNNLPNVTHMNLGVYYGATEAKLFWRGSNEGAIFLEQVDAGNDKVDRGEKVNLVELESLGLETPDLIKMDVEGAEVNIIEHSQMVKDCPNLIIEWHPNLDPIEFFRKHLPKHRITINLSNQQFLLQK